MDSLIYHNVKQGSDEWLHVKAGKFSGTDASTFLVKGRGVGQIGAGLKSLIYRKVSECVIGPTLDGYTSDVMQRGNDLEPLARSRYERENWQDVDEVGFIQKGNFFGISPDGLVSDNGAIEIKCPGGPTWVEWNDCKQLVADIPKAYYAQMQWLMFITERDWVDYIVYNPDFAPLDYTETRVLRCDEVQEVFKTKADIVAKEMTRLLNKVALKEAA